MAGVTGTTSLSTVTVDLNRPGRPNEIFDVSYFGVDEC